MRYIAPWDVKEKLPHIETHSLTRMCESHNTYNHYMCSVCGIGVASVVTSNDMYSYAIYYFADGNRQVAKLLKPKSCEQYIMIQALE